MSYHSNGLKAPLLEPFKSLHRGCFSRALVKCVLKARTIPNVIRSDRGPEMRSAVTEEFLSICGCKVLFGLSLTPRHQAPAERGHQKMMAQHLVLMHTICCAFPQEWPAMIPAVEYLYWTAPQGAHGLSATTCPVGTPCQRRSMSACDRSWSLRGCRRPTLRCVSSKTSGSYTPCSTDSQMQGGGGLQIHSAA